MFLLFLAHPVTIEMKGNNLCHKETLCGSYTASLDRFCPVDIASAKNCMKRQYLYRYHRL